MKYFCALLLLCSCMTSKSKINNGFEKDSFQTEKGLLTITFIGHASLMLEWNNHTILVDPWSNVIGKRELPKADLILLTHHHMDHLDTAAIAKYSNPETELILTKTCFNELNKGKVANNGDTIAYKDLQIIAFPAYNIQHMKTGNIPFHPKGEGNGYIIQFANINVYVAGDTENIPEMKNLTDIDIAFLPMNLPYTMTPEMVFDAAIMFYPKILYPYHYGNTDTKIIQSYSEKSKFTVRIRQMQ